MKHISILFFLLYSINLFAQECTCKEQFLFVKQYYENNNPAFQQIKDDRQLYNKYKSAVAQITGKIAKERNTDLCNIYFNEYLKVLKDHHSHIDFKLQRKNIDLSSQTVLDSFKASPSYRAFKLKKIDTSQVIAQLNNKPANDIEGIYVSESGITVAVMQGDRNHYEGIVLKKNKLLDIGHILFTLTREEDGSFLCAYNLGLLGFNFNTAFINNMRIVNGKIPKMGFNKINAGPDEKLWEFRPLNDDTYYLSLRSFAYHLKPQLDSLYREIIPKIAQKKFLILDIRDNGGGSESCYFDLLPLIYTKPMNVDEVQVWVSPDNIKSYEGVNEELLSRMKNAKPFSFIPQKEHAVTKLEYTGARYPEKIALLFNKGTASSAEGLVTYAIQSEKVITLGQHSGGFMGYGDVKSTEIPCGKFILFTTTTKYKENSKYEFVGIPPMIPLDNKVDWIQAALAELAKTK
ncbi:hypothetical protein J2T02_002659 [Chitinophaga terrae (ex Kim and Jung 2007)]|uniref:S41 family peptidase n=1 Tax=Chitinophaga terrae (ex Kim and Jung 2007) TaxID=408074 RepID=UPI00277F8141|nr:S41 family peptidase [Chitinophaga terrae (ex Kim and Jung 2007)]MDQ0107540.1 hypothetical protein [Chitinophaga terrae (ex Kim and Jung 2007)]